ncbi:MAG TPA: glycine--tRNA ligase [Candidatus Saccharimonadales bacterium]|nr:glycine--tRNA ligase [Candidatus Saccharimonadales bacterium]
MEKIVALAKRRGFIYPGSDIYGGLANTYDYGPMGTELLRNIKNLWWRYFVQENDDMVGLDASIISHHRIWEASGHVASFADAMVDCKNCKARMRADHLLENYLDSLDEETRKTLIEYHKTTDKQNAKDFVTALETGKVEGFSITSLEELMVMLGNLPNPLVCPNCGQQDWTPVRKFNQLFPVQLGLVEGDEGSAYLRGETAQGIFVNFKNIVASNRVKLPFGVGQVGKSFRNEITPGNSIFRTIEFEQGEIEYFFDPEENNWEELFERWKKSMFEFVTKQLGIKEENLRWRPHTDKERSFYSERTEDLEYNFPFGFKELWGLAYRTNYDLTQHQEFSKKDLTYIDQETGKKILPHVIEPAVGINRLFLMTMIDSYSEKDGRISLNFHPKVAPVKVAVFPLLRNKQELVAKAQEIYKDLKKEINGIVQYDDRGNIGKRYLAQDEIGTPYCITVDFQTLEDQTVTVRDRDTGTQERISIDQLVTYVRKKTY